VVSDDSWRSFWLSSYADFRLTFTRSVHGNAMPLNYSALLQFIFIFLLSPPNSVGECIMFLGCPFIQSDVVSTICQ